LPEMIELEIDPTFQFGGTRIFRRRHHDEASHERIVYRALNSGTFCSLGRITPLGRIPPLPPPVFLDQRNRIDRKLGIVRFQNFLTDLHLPPTEIFSGNVDRSYVLEIEAHRLLLEITLRPDHRVLP